MPALGTTLHLDMHRVGRKRRTWFAKMKKAFTVLFNDKNVYGLEWGDPETCPPLAYVRDKFLLPYISQQTITIDVGPGGGRWTRYMLAAKTVYAVDYHRELLDELKSNYNTENLKFIKNNGDDFPNIPDYTVDFLFSFGVFVHLDIEIINRYLRNMKRLLKPSSNVVIQYSDKSKPLAQSNPGFSQNDPDVMRQLVLSHGYYIYEEDTKTLWHSSIIRFGIRSSDI